ncbi:MAG: HD-GYP domain-containing protein [Phycisphaerales bacterium]
MSPDQVVELVHQIEVKDLSTAAHTWRVVLYTRAIFEELGSTPKELLALTQGAALHDVGKLDVPDHILQKPAKLTDDEFEIIKIHPVSGYARLLQMGVEEDAVLDLVRYHHERWDGGGYPFSLAGEDIPTAARFFAVIDSFDAMTSVRPYRKEIGQAAADRAIEQLEGGSGTQYDPEGVGMFTDLYRTGELDYILHYFNDTVPLPRFGVHEVERLKREIKGA